MKQFFVLLTLLLLPVTSWASASEVKDLQESRVQIISSAEQVAPGDVFYLAAHVKLADHWHTYTYNPGDAGIPFSAEWNLPEGFSISETYWPPFRQFDEAGLTTYGYSDEVVFTYQVTAPETIIEPIDISADVNYLVCKDVCIPQSAQLSMQMGVGPMRNSIYDSLIIGWHDESKLETDWLELKKKSDASEAVEVEQLDAPPIATYDGTPELEAEEIAELAPETKPQKPLITYLLFALLGGLILNLMPCVFPVLSLKAIAIANHAAGELKEVREESLAYTAGVLTCFVALAGLLISLQSAGAAIGWGFQFQSPGFVALMALLLFFIGLNLSGLFELPVLLGGVAGKIGLTKGPKGSFLTGLLAALVATPCTAPFMAPAIGFALSQDAITALLVFVFLGLGLALPFILLSFFPALLKWLPKPGAWMKTLKHFLAFPMYLSAIWLLWVLGSQTGIEGIIATLLFIVLAVFFIWAKGKCRPSAFCSIANLFIIVSLLMVLLNAVVQFVENKPAISSPEQTELHLPYSAEALAELRADGKAVFVDATASWCITCKVNYRVAISRDEVQQAFKDQNITYMVADWTSRDENITNFLSSFGYKGVPLYVYYAPGKEGVVLPQLLTTDIILNTISTTH